MAVLRPRDRHRAGQPSSTPTPRDANLHELLANAVQRGYVVGPDGSLDIEVVASGQVSVIAIDPATSAIRARLSLGTPPSGTAPDGIASSSGALWLVVNTALENCAVDQLNATTLAVQDTMPLPACPLSSPDIAGTNTEVWADDGKGHLVQIDMAHKDFSATIALPTTTKTPLALSASSTSVFWASATGIYRVEADTSSLTQISGPSDLAIPVGDGVWRAIDAGTDGSRRRSEHANVDITFVPSANAATTYTMIGADATNIYTEKLLSGHDILENPTDGSAVAGLGTSAYASDNGTGLIIGAHNAFRIFETALQPGAPQALSIEELPVAVRPAARQLVRLRFPSIRYHFADPRISRGRTRSFNLVT